MATAKKPAQQNTSPATVPTPSSTMGEGLGDAAGKANRLLVRCPVAGYRRGGRAWPLGETEVGFAEFSDEQVGQLLADPRLIVVVIAGAD